MAPGLKYQGEGNCAFDSECEESLVCGHENCANKSKTLQHCCTKSCRDDSDCVNQECNTDIQQCQLDSNSIHWSKCSWESPCSKGEGDCDEHGDCKGELMCGSGNCPSGPEGMDCCEQEIYTGKLF